MIDSHNIYKQKQNKSNKTKMRKYFSLHCGGICGKNLTQR